MRKWCIAIGAAWLAITSSQAPLAHVHPDDADHQHANGHAHLHFPVHASKQSTLEPADDDEATVWLDWAPVTKQRVIVPYVAATPVVVTEPRPVKTERIAEVVPQSHDPPVLGSLPPRSPPV